MRLSYFIPAYLLFPIALISSFKISEPCYSQSRLFLSRADKCSTKDIQRLQSQAFTVVMTIYKQSKVYQNRCLRLCGVLVMIARGFSFFFRLSYFGKHSSEENNLATLQSMQSHTHTYIHREMGKRVPILDAVFRSTYPILCCSLVKFSGFLLHCFLTPTPVIILNSMCYSSHCIQCMMPPLHWFALPVKQCKNSCTMKQMRCFISYQNIDRSHVLTEQSCPVSCKCYHKDFPCGHTIFAVLPLWKWRNVRHLINTDFVI